MPRRRKHLVLVLRRRREQIEGRTFPGLPLSMAERVRFALDRARVRLLNEAERLRRLETPLDEIAPGNRTLAQLHHGRINVFDVVLLQEQMKPHRK